MERFELVATVQASRSLRHRGDVEGFDDALAELADLPRPAVEPYLPQLFLAFNDQCEHPEVMYGLLHFVEDFDFEPAMRAYISVLPLMWQHAPDWAMHITNRVLNSEPDRHALRTLYHTMPPSDRQALRTVLEDIAAGTEYEEKKAHVQEVLA